MGVGGDCKGYCENVKLLRKSQAKLESVALGNNLGFVGLECIADEGNGMWCNGVEVDWFSSVQLLSCV